MITGLSEKQIKEITVQLVSFTNIYKAAVFGSRAMGNSKPGSDVDIAIWGVGIGPIEAKNLAIRLNEYTSLPYKFDVVAYDAISDNALKEHINAVGKVFFERDTIA